MIILWHPHVHQISIHSKMHSNSFVYYCSLYILIISCVDPWTLSISPSILKYFMLSWYKISRSSNLGKLWAYKKWHALFMHGTYLNVSVKIKFHLKVINTGLGMYNSFLYQVPLSSFVVSSFITHLLSLVLGLHWDSLPSRKHLT